MKFMQEPDMIHIEVAYAKPEEQVILSLEVPRGTVVEEALFKSQILLLFPEIDLNQNKVGIFSKLCTLHTPLREHDRIEIYRPLLADPKQMRKQRAAHQDKKKSLDGTSHSKDI